MRLLLDTHVLLWALGDVGRLDPASRGALAAGANDVLVSVASIWEVGIKRALGTLTIEGSLAGHAERSGFRMLPILAAHAERASSLPAHHRDPVDRMLIAQALEDGLTLVTRDPVFVRYGVPTFPA